MNKHALVSNHKMQLKDRHHRQHLLSRVVTMVKQQGLCSWAPAFRGRQNLNVNLLFSVRKTNSNTSQPYSFPFYWNIWGFLGGCYILLLFYGSTRFTMEIVLLALGARIASYGSGSKYLGHLFVHTWAVQWMYTSTHYMGLSEADFILLYFLQEKYNIERWDLACLNRMGTNFY